MIAHLILSEASSQSASEIKSPNEEFPARVPLDITFSAILLVLLTINVYIVVKLKVHENCNSLAIMACLSVIEAMRICIFIWRILENKYSQEEWFWYRATTDLANYLLGIIAIILLAQWHQTFCVLSNPTRAIKTLYNNWAKVFLLTIVTLETILFIFDFIVIVADWKK